MFWKARALSARSSGTALKIPYQTSVAYDCRQTETVQLFPAPAALSITDAGSLNRRELEWPLRFPTISRFWAADTEENCGFQAPAAKRGGGFGTKSLWRISDLMLRASESRLWKSVSCEIPRAARLSLSSILRSAGTT